ncbi:Phosphodiesterase [Candidatus Methanobinarius endosymbioticus]|uniref:Phosphoesterase n=1 Tax=Candidatus Methanobinarius endosymbioticus TaxID=2006182 RepID=A0A366MBX0_9EURY|nr:Phosphodiesterase [Candidatus Methanobinarius endosymbioticus]
MIIGVISDTHIPDRTEQIPPTVLEIFKNVDLIMHAGDLTSMGVKEELEKIAPVLAVQGNIDRVHNLDLPVSLKTEIEGITIGIKHGEVYPKGNTQQLYYIAKELEVKVLVSGHTHKAAIEQIDDVLLLNPGSPTAPRLTDPTVILVTIEDGEIDVEIKKVGKSACSALNFEK